jgi:hypothetical protein
METRGWFQFVLAALAAGDFASLVEAEHLPVDMLQDISRVLDGAREFASISRKGWLVLDHPVLGQVSWKSGIDFRSACPYLIVRLNGRLVLRAWPGSEVDLYGPRAEETRALLRLGSLEARATRGVVATPI